MNKEIILVITPVVYFEGRCNKCILLKDNHCLKPESFGPCVLGFNYQIKIKPEKLQTQYEWKKERLSSIKIRPSDFGGYSSNEIESLKKEELELIEWLKANKPSNWVKCSRGNTKIGDEVREITTKYTDYGLAKISMFLENNPQYNIVILRQHNGRHVPEALHCYEINLAEKSDNLPD